MAETHVVSGLAAKRSELTGQIEHYHTLIKRLTADVTHIDAALKIFAPDFFIDGQKKAQKQQQPDIT